MGWEYSTRPSILYVNPLLNKLQFIRGFITGNHSTGEFSDLGPLLIFLKQIIYLQGIVPGTLWDIQGIQGLSYIGGIYKVDMGHMGCII